MAVAMDQAFWSLLGDLRWFPIHQRVRAWAADAVVADSTRTRLVWEPGRVVGSYAVPRGDLLGRLVDPSTVAPAADLPRFIDPGVPFEVHSASGTIWTVEAADRRLPGAAFTLDDPDLDGWVVLDWAAFDRWTEEEQDVVAHPHDPLQRIDVLRSDRHVTVTLDDELLADSRHPLLLLETHLPPRWYLPARDVRMDLLAPSTTATTCAYKGRASYLSARVGGREVTDVAWRYPDPLHDAEPVRDAVSFYPELVEIRVD